MKILLVSSGSGSRGGGEIFLVYLAQGLADRGHEVVVWMPSHPRMDELADKCSRFGRVIRTDYRNTYDYAARARARTVLNGVPIPDLERVQDLRVQKRRELGLKDDDLLVLGLGRLVEQKRPDLFLTAARELHRQFPTTKFLWLGDGKFSPNWDERVVREKLGGIVSRTDWNSEVLPFLSAADLLLHVAEYEGLPLAVIEAMSAKVPCAIRRNLTIEMPFFNDSNVIFVDDAAGLAAKLKDGERLSAIASNGSQLADE